MDLYDQHTAPDLYLAGITLSMASTDSGGWHFLPIFILNRKINC